MKLSPQKLEGWGYCMVETSYNPNFYRFWLILPCDGQTIAYNTLYAVAIVFLSVLGLWLGLFVSVMMTSDRCPWQTLQSSSCPWVMAGVIC